MHNSSNLLLGFYMASAMSKNDNYYNGLLFSTYFRFHETTKKETISSLNENKFGKPILYKFDIVFNPVVRFM